MLLRLFIIYFIGHHQVNLVNLKRKKRKWKASEGIKQTCTNNNTSQTTQTKPYLGIKRPQLDVLGVCDKARIGVFPGDRHGRLLVGVYEQVKASRLVQQRQEGHRSCDLANDRLNLLGYLFGWLI